MDTQEYNALMAAISRDRHGRGMRRPLPSKLFKPGTRTELFHLVVEQTCEYLRSEFAELAGLNWRIEEVPQLDRGEPLTRFSARTSSMTIVLYRIPIERLSFRGADLRVQIEQAVISAAAALIDRDPWELIHPN
jgi:hypothetical protein